MDVKCALHKIGIDKISMSRYGIKNIPVDYTLFQKIFVNNELEQCRTFLIKPNCVSLPVNTTCSKVYLNTNCVFDLVIGVCEWEFSYSEAYLSEYFPLVWEEYAFTEANLVTTIIKS